MLAPLTQIVRSGTELDPAGIADAVRCLTSETLPVEDKADFLTALAVRGETPGEIAGFARELRTLSVPVSLPEALRDVEILDVCGTGGDRQNTFNISTTVAFVCAGAGVSVAKHGNRAITSRSGSADVLQALGVPTDLPPEKAADSLARHRFAFFFAPRYHPAFKHIAPARSLCASRGQRTLFNLLGPLLNPARPTVQLLGVPRPELCDPMARALQSLGLRRALVACGEVPSLEPQATGPAFLDELSTLGDNTLAEFHQDRGFHVSRWSPRDFPLQPSTVAGLAGGDATDNAAILRDLLAGSDRGPRRDAVLLNAGAALMIAGRTRSIVEGWALAAETLDSGLALKALQRVVAAADA